MLHFPPTARLLPLRLLSPLFEQGSVTYLAAHRLLFASGDAPDGCYRIEIGLVRVVMTSPTGDNRILAMLGPGSIVGELSLLDGLPRSASVITNQDSTFRFVSRAAFLDFCRDNTEIQQELVMVLAARLRETNHALAAATFLSAKGRIARALLELARHVGEEAETGATVIRDKVSQRHLADLAGVARENVNRAFSEWTKRKLITRSAGSLKINDVAALTSEMDFEQRPRIVAAMLSARAGGRLSPAPVTVERPPDEKA
jgi:CRP/FNR family cyclic AMP-dependent transcriptional regulator